MNATTDMTHAKALEQVEQAARPRMGANAERPARQGEERLTQRVSREKPRSRSLEEASPRPVSATGAVAQRMQKMTDEERAAARQVQQRQAQPAAHHAIEDRMTVKMAAWGALFVSLVTAFLLGLYSSQQFSPAFNFYQIEANQKEFQRRLDALTHRAQLRGAEDAIHHAQFQIVMQKDYETAVSLLEDARDELKRYIDMVSIEQTGEPKELVASLERMIQELRQGPPPLEQKLMEISGKLRKITPQK